MARATTKDKAPKKTSKRTIRPPADQSAWRKHLRTEKIKFTDGLKEVFLRKLAQTGRKYQAAAAAGVTLRCAQYHEKNDPEFAAGIEEALAEYRDWVVEQGCKLAFEGVEEPIIGGKFKDRVVATKRVFATNLAAMEMRRVEPGYRDRAEVDLNVKGGVLIAPAGKSPEDWEQQFAKPAPDAEQ